MGRCMQAHTVGSACGKLFTLVRVLVHLESWGDFFGLFIYVFWVQQGQKVQRTRDLCIASRTQYFPLNWFILLANYLYNPKNIMNKPKKSLWVGEITAWHLAGFSLHAGPPAPVLTLPLCSCMNIRCESALWDQPVWMHLHICKKMDVFCAVQNHEICPQTLVFESEVL